MIDINLLGSESKRSWRLHALKRLTVLLAALTCAAILIIASALLIYSAKVYKNLEIAKNKISVFQKEESEQEEEIKKEIDKINAKISYFGNLLENHKSTSPVLEDLSKTLPSGVKLTAINLKIEPDKASISLKGSGSSRADFLKFQSLLEKNINFFNLRSPLSNITKKENIEFAVVADVSGELLKK